MTGLKNLMENFTSRLYQQKKESVLKEVIWNLSVIEVKRKTE